MTSKFNNKIKKLLLEANRRDALKSLVGAFDQFAINRSDKFSILRPGVSKRQYIFNKLVKHGLTEIAASAIIGNIDVESGGTFDPSIKQHNGGPGRGLVQWETGGRFDTDSINLVDYALSTKRAWNNLDAQIDFILYELNNHPEYKKVKTLLNSSKNVKQATMIFCLKYEKAGKPHWNRRLNSAENTFREFSSAN